MDTFSIISGFFVVILFSFCAFILYSKYKLTKLNEELNNKLRILEVELLTQRNEKKNNFQEKNQEKKIPHAHKVIPENLHSSSQELVELRKDHSKLKDELKKLKEELRFKEKEVKEAEKVYENKLYVLQQENMTYVEQMKDLNSRIKELLVLNKDQVSQTQFEQKQQEFLALREDSAKLKQKFNDLDKAQRQLTQKNNQLVEKLKSAEAELSQWQSVSKTLSGKPLRPETLLIWKDRALAGRKMYRLMRQMRELSDEKITTYQHGVVALSKWVLQQKNIQVSEEVTKNEVLADRLLAEAWNAILPPKVELESKSVVADDRTEEETQPNL